jgi:hypothetical protein
MENETQHLTDTPSAVITISELSPLESVANYYLEGKHLMPAWQELAKQAGLLMVAISGAGLYAVAADKYAKEQPDNNWEMSASFIIGTCTPALVILYNSTDLFINQQRAEQIPKLLKGTLVKLRTAKQQWLKNIGITVGSMISAIPLSLVSFLYPIPNVSTAGLVAIAAITELDNTILHFLPIELALQNPLYRVPFLPFEYSYKLLSTCQLTNEEKQQRRFEQEKKHIYGLFKQRFINRLTQVQQRIVIHGFSFDKKNLSYKTKLTDELYYQDNGQSSSSYLEMLFNFHHNTDTESPKTTFGRVKEKLDKVLHPITYGLGAFWVTSSCIGYLVAPINELNHLISSNANNTNTNSSYYSYEDECLQMPSMVTATLIASPSIYFLGVLTAFFGGNALRNTYDYFSSWKNDELKIPLEFKLYPKTFMLLITVSAYLSCFSYAAAVELIEDNFVGQKWDTWRDYLIWLSKTGMPFLSMTAMIDFYRTAINKLVLYCGQSENNMLIRLNATLDQLKNGITLMNTEQFLQSLATLNQKQLNLFLDLQHPEEKKAFEKDLRSLIPHYSANAELRETIMQLLHTTITIEETAKHSKHRNNSAPSRRLKSIFKYKRSKSHDDSFFFKYRHRDTAGIVDTADTAIELGESITVSPSSSGLQI